MNNAFNLVVMSIVALIMFEFVCHIRSLMKYLNFRGNNHIKILVLSFSIGMIFLNEIVQTNTSTIQFEKNA